MAKYFENYDILMEGVQLKQKNSKLITIKKKPNSIFFDNNYNDIVIDDITAVVAFF